MNDRDTLRDAAIELVARRIDGLSPADVRRILRPFRREPFTRLPTEALLEALGLELRDRVATYLAAAASSGESSE